MSNHERTTIRCWTTRFLVVTVVVAVGATGRGYAVEARTWLGTVVAAVTVSGQDVALRLARKTARAASAPAAVAALRELVSSSSRSGSSFAVPAVEALQ